MGKRERVRKKGALCLIESITHTLGGECEVVKIRLEYGTMETNVDDEVQAAQTDTWIMPCRATTQTTYTFFLAGVSFMRDS